MQRRDFLKLGAISLAALHFPQFAAAQPAVKLPKHLQGNPLLDFSGLPRFAAIRPEHINPAIDFLLAEYRRATERLTAQKSPTWENFYLPLADTGDRFSRAWGVVSHLHAVQNTEALRKAHEAAQTKVSAFQTWYGLHKGLYRSFQALKNSPDFAGYDTARKKAVEDALLDFRLSGIALPPAQQKIYARINARLSELSTRFSNNLLDAGMAWEKILPHAEDLAGLPPLALEAAKDAAKSRKKKGYRLTLDYPSYAAVITYADNPELRREIYTAYTTRASDQGKHPAKWDNSAVIDEILRLRRRLAKLLGFKTYADYALVTRMAESPEQVFQFLENILKRVRPQAQRELAELEQYAGKKLNYWDLSYYAEKLKAERYSVNNEMLRPYFPAPKVLSGLFEVSKRLFGLDIREKKGVEVWNKDVRFFELFDSQNQHIASFYLDLYAREHKRGGAWMDSAIERRRLPDGSIQKPVAYLVLNCRAPAEGKPALLEHDDVTTLFHEFGHGLHHMLTKIDVAAVSGINGVPWDAVEFPSQMLEGWTWDKTALKLISGHYESGEPLPDAWLDKMLAAKNFQAARAMVRQLEFALLDFRLHDGSRSGEAGFLRDTVRDIAAKVSVMPEPDFTRRSHSFAHIFSGGYAAGYYSYLWAEVLAADAFSRFEADGIFNRATGQAFVDNFLSQGGSRPPMEMFKAFMGRAPEADALLKQRGIGS